jgi:hypothetical protein
MPNHLIVWDVETVPDLRGFAAANGHDGKADHEIREAMGDKFPKHIYHSIICIGALVAHCDNGHTEYVYAGSNLFATIDQKIVNGTATGSPITRYNHPDNLGSTNVTSDATMNIAQWFDYAPYGSGVPGPAQALPRETRANQVLAAFDVESSPHSVIGAEEHKGNTESRGSLTDV